MPAEYDILKELKMISVRYPYFSICLLYLYRVWECTNLEINNSPHEKKSQVANMISITLQLLMKLPDIPIYFLIAGKSDV